MYYGYTYCYIVLYHIISYHASITGSATAREPELKLVVRINKSISFELCRAIVSGVEFGYLVYVIIIPICGTITSVSGLY